MVTIHLPNRAGTIPTRKTHLSSQTGAFLVFTLKN
nr:MAG TPA: hypothetical protein [Caudoviricetes sp.]